MNYLTLVGYIIIPIISLFLIPFIRSYIVNFESRIKNLESSIIHKVEESDVRLLITDKLDPVKDTLEDIKTQIEKLMDYLIKNAK